MNSLQELIINTKDEYKEQSIGIDPSQKKSQELIETKLKQSDEKDKSKMTKNAIESKASADAVNGTKTSKLNKVNNIACLAHSLTAYLITVNNKKNSEQLKNLTVKLYDSVSLWVSRLFR